MTGSPSELKRTVGVDLITVKTTEGRIPQLLPQEIGLVVRSEDRLLEIQTVNGDLQIAPIVDYLEKNGVTITSITLSRPTLGDVFLKYGGESLESGTIRQIRSTRRSFAR